MPKQYSRKRAASEEYENDGGFVEDAPKNKKTKAVSTSEVKSKTSTKSGGYENQYWELGCTRRVQLNEFKGNQLVDIREYYEKDDRMLPGKKGISLNIEQFNTFIEQLPEIEQALKAKGISLPRPVYSGISKKDDEDDKDDEDSDVYEPCHKTAAQAEEQEREVKSSATNKLDKFKHKANHEATSEEDN